ncbi:MAG TPA: hypothetical protein VIV40_32900 [Kofleriaceae bacterium]
MRALLCCAVITGLAACGPKVAPKGSAFDEDLESRTAETAPAPIEQPRPEAPPGKGLRSGTIERAKLVAVLDSGPGAFLRQLEVAPRMDGERFIGWQLVQLLDRSGPLVDVDVVPGDVLLAVNGRTISRPDQLQSIWDSLRTANELRAQLWRGDAKLELAFSIEPKVDPATVPPLPTTKVEPPKPDAAKPAKPAPAPTKQPPVQLTK